ncbi:MAG: preprotein translocase subunit SecG [Patescibacteria group bacterium]
MLMQILNISQLILAILLIIAILLQQQGAGLGAGFGGTGGGVQNTRRGPEKLLYNTTIVISILLFSISLAAVII